MTLPDSSRRAVAIAARRTTVPRCTCQNCCGSSCGSSSRSDSADQVLALGGDHAHVLVGGLEVQHLVDRHQVHQVARRWPGSPRSRGRRRPRRAGARRAARAAGPASAPARRRHPLARRCGAVGQRALQPLDAGRQPRAVHRLEQVVDRLRVEGLQRVLVVGGDEHQQRERRRPSGQSSASACAASSPLRPGMRMSRKHRSGCSASACVTALGAVADHARRSAARATAAPARLAGRRPAAVRLRRSARWAWGCSRSGRGRGVCRGR